ncbi:hypothetical protein M8C21_007383 [Ambrosia artemisiifolia]|uniref:Uncharacterized protein n=1 Tax=Ambrosia artemisiifolia TaxID=4212 RepID=A0AAD5G592_AMBAR|nr:hypothetical protein M8C21_007383 [Ambrosia artemisiifolia]
MLHCFHRADLKLEMIRLYRRLMFEGVNTSSTTVIPLASASTNAELEMMICNIYKETICPMFYADFNKIHQNFLSMVREIFGLDLNLCNTESTSRPQSLQLMFLNGISTPVSTGKIIEGVEEKPFVVALVDGVSGQLVTTGAEAGTEVEIVVLEGDSNDDVADNWTSDEFNNNIVSEWKGKKVLKGNKFVKLNEGIVSVDRLSFTHTSVWKGNIKCRMGARAVNAVFTNRVKEAKTESFLLEIPSLTDHVYRLHQISNRSDCYKRLKNEGVKTVMDLLALHAINPQRLKDTLKVSPNTWKIIMDHANMCKDDTSKAVYLYPNPRDDQKSNGVAFNILGRLMGIIADSHFVPCDKLPDDKRADAQKLIVSSSENWKEVVSFNDQDSLGKYLQSRPTFIPSTHNKLSVVIRQTTDPHTHTNLTSPKCQSQSPKRPATKQAISNSPKQPRYDHPKLSPSMSSIGMGTSMCHKALNWASQPDDDDDGDDILKYLYLFDRWKIVCCAVGWISMISKLRKRRMTICHDNTVILIAASIEHAQTCD